MWRWYTRSDDMLSARSFVRSQTQHSSFSFQQISCPAFTCTTDCYAKFTNESATPCPSVSSYCVVGGSLPVSDACLQSYSKLVMTPWVSVVCVFQLIKQAMSYSIKCSVSCGMSCGNGTVSNCSLACCNTSSCLNNSLLALSSSLSTTGKVLLLFISQL